MEPVMRAVSWCLACAFMACGEPPLERPGDFPTPPELPAVEREPVAIAPPALPKDAERPRLSPVAVDPPVLTPCPSGWREVELDSTIICDPWPEQGMNTCERGEAHFPGTPGCAPVGAPCPKVQWPEGLPADRPIIYVRSSTVPHEGSGTREDPYSDLGRALSEAGTYGTLALAPGTYQGPITLGQVTLWGTCARDTMIVSRSQSESGAIVAVTRRDTVLKNVTISGPRRGIQVYSGAAVELDGVIIEDAIGLGFAAQRATIRARNLVIRRIDPFPSNQEGGYGLALYDEADTRIEGLVVENVRRVGVFATGGAALTLRDGAVRRVFTQVSDPGGLGIGMWLDDGAVGSSRRVVFQEVGAAGIYLDDQGTTLTAEDLVIQQTRGDGVGAWGVGLDVITASASVRRALIRSVRTFGAGADDSGYFHLSDAVIADVQSDAATRIAGIGADVQRGAHLELSRVSITRARSAGLHAWDPGTVLRGTHVRVTDTRGQALQNAVGFGAAAELGAHLTLQHAELAHNRSAGAYAFGEGSTLELYDAIVRDTDIDEWQQLFGNGLRVREGSTGKAERVLFERNRSDGILQQGGTMSLTDVEVRDTRQDVEGAFGRGISIERDGVAVLDRVLVENNWEIGVAVLESGASLTARDLIIRNTTDGGFDGGLGLVVNRGATATVTRILAEENQSMAIANGGGGSLVLEDAIVRNTRPNRNLRAGIGLAALEGSTRVRRILLEHNALASIRAEVGRLDLEDATIRDTRSKFNGGTTGIGLDLFEGTHTTARRISIERSREAGIRILGDGTRAELEDVFVTDTLPWECTPQCAPQGLGVGLGVLHGAAARVERFLITRSAVVGVQLLYSGSLDLIDGEISFNPVGINVVLPGYEESRLDRDVYLHDNVTPTNVASLPQLSETEDLPDLP